MKRLMNTFATSLLMFITLTACGDGMKEQKYGSVISDIGHAVIRVDSKTHTLPIQLCSEPRTDTYEGEKVTSYSIQAFNKESNIKLSIFGTDDAEGKSSTYIIDFNGGFLANGIGYSEKIPFDLFDGKSLKFKGKAVARTMKGKDKSQKSIEISVACK